MKQISILNCILLFILTNSVRAQSIIKADAPADQIYIREKPVWQSRYPQGKGLIVFSTNACGKIQKLGNDSFVFYADSIRQLKDFHFPCSVFHSSPQLFNDCVYFDPLSSFEKDPLMERATRERTIFKRVDSLNLLIDPENSTPASFRMYLDTSRVQTDYADRLVADTILPEEITPYIQSFYFRKYEVSNKEYREFVNWVRDSIARVQLGYVNADGKLDWLKKIDWADTNIRNKTGLYLKNEERFWHRHEVNTKLLVYKFTNSPSEYGNDTINCYPDTLCWVHDFMYSFGEPMTNMYFWHPAYNDYPVAGVNYWQCLAFLEWKTKQLQQQFNAQGKKYRIVCALPSDAEWDIVTTASNNDMGKLELFPDHYTALADNSWLTDLRLNSYSLNGFTITEPEKKEKSSVISAGPGRHSFPYYPSTNPPDQLLRGEDVTYGDPMADGYFHTAPVDPQIRIRGPHKSSDFQKTNQRFIAHTDNSTGICYLDGNLSEWLSNDLDTCWRPVFTKHLVLPQGPLNESANVSRQMENYYYKQLPAHGKLVRGSNWYDERFNDKYGKNTAGMNAKTFENPSKSHSTVGFRYVIYVYPE